jgi:uncharacterized protein YecE (DUF72 family)
MTSREATMLAKRDFRIPPAYRALLRVGACSWKYESWKGLVYRRDADYGPFDYLPDYARSFGTVEVDQWFWSLFPGAVRLPDPKVVRRYAESVPDDFMFSVKVPNAITLTHFYAKQPKASAEFADRPNEHFLSLDLFGRFLKTLEPMGGKLGPLLFQFAYLNRRKMASAKAFLAALDAFFARAPKGYQYAVECRNPNYLARPFFEFLAERGLGMVFLDGYYMPPLGEVFERFAASPAPFSVVRLHGADREGIEERTGGLWNEVREPKPDGLRAAAAIVDFNLARSFQSLVNVNNHYEGSAPLTIERFLRLLARSRT